MSKIAAHSGNVSWESHTGCVARRERGINHMLGVSVIPHVRTPVHQCPLALGHVTHAPFSAFPPNLSSMFLDTDGEKCHVRREHSITHLNVDAQQMSPFNKQIKVRIR